MQLLRTKWMEQEVLDLMCPYRQKHLQYVTVLLCTLVEERGLNISM